MQDALDRAEVRPPKEPRGRDLEGGGAQAHGQAVEHAHADGLVRVRVRVGARVRVRIRVRVRV